MQIHVTCGRGTEIFVKDELLCKLKCQVISVEDGKVFFSVADTVHGSDDCFKNSLFSLKSVERIFITVTHFPTCEIKGNGKIKFLHSLKQRILNHVCLEKAAEHVQHLQTEQVSCRECPSGGKDGVLKGDPLQIFEWKDYSKLPASHPVQVSSNLTLTSIFHSCGSSTDRQNSKAHLHLTSTGNEGTDPCAETEGKSYDEHYLCGQGCVSAGHHHQAHQILDQTECVSVNVKPQDTSFDEPAGKGQKLESGQGSNNCSVGQEEYHFGCLETKKRKRKLVTSSQKVYRDLSFRFSVKCKGWCKKWLQPQRLARELGIRLSCIMGWTVDLKTPDLEICIHINDDFITAGIPLKRQPLSNRSYILNAGLRSTVCWIMARKANIQPGNVVLDPMCGKATILLEAAKEYSQAAAYIGCDLDDDQLQAAVRNVKFAQVDHCVHLFQANALDLPLKCATIDRIVCDAPFGQKHLSTTGNMPQFYKDLLQEMYRLLVPGGLAILLTSQELLPVVEKCVRLARESPSHISLENTESCLQHVFEETGSMCLFVCSENAERHARGLSVEGFHNEGMNCLHRTAKALPNEGTGHLKLLGGLSPLRPTSEAHSLRSSNQTSGTVRSKTTHSLSPGQTVNQTSGTVRSKTTHSLSPGQTVNQISGTICSKTTHSLSSGQTVNPNNRELHINAVSSSSARLSSLISNVTSSCPKITVETSAKPAQNGDSRLFLLLSNHFVKLGETHAYIVALQKPVFTLGV